MAEDVDVFLRESLAQAGVTVQPDDLARVKSVHTAFAAGMRALADADLREIPIEWDLDPSQAPRT